MPGSENSIRGMFCNVYMLNKITINFLSTRLHQLSMSQTEHADGVVVSARPKH